MFNFSANHMVLKSSSYYEKCTLFIMEDMDTNRCYKIYDYSKKNNMGMHLTEVPTR